ncbi:unnamed protein product [Moneuplotes crassus]|uniref:DNA replication licensing factor MCM2 n=1 Tax=Euplotes crassus TaxID=5936 RepID=A0AAD2D8Y7_EUPCR|nr:unnamed protein product [Moneuplotes crassus]
MSDNSNRKRKFHDIDIGEDFEESENQDDPDQRVGSRQYHTDPMEMDDGENFSEEENHNYEPDIIPGDHDGNDSDNCSGEDLMDNAEEDYKEIPELDRYENRGLDDDQEVNHLQLNADDRAKVDLLLDQRDRREGIDLRRVPVAMMDEENSENSDLARELRKERLRRDHREEEDDEIDEGYLDYEEAKGNLSEWLRQPKTVKFIRHQFSSFLRSYKDEHGIDVYEQRITEMCSKNSQSLEITYSHLSTKNPTLAIWVAEHPKLIIPIFNEVAFELVNEVFPSYENIYKEIFIRIKDLPIEDKLRDLRQMHLNALIKIKGVITKRTGIFPKMKRAFFFCKCGERKGPIIIALSEEAQMGNCYRCHSNGPFTLDSADTEYSNYQKITVQETPGTVPPGRVPRQKEVILTGDLVDCARPGDEVEVTGVYTSHFDHCMNIQHGFPIFYTFIEANYVKSLQDVEHNALTEDEVSKIRKLSREKNIAKRIIGSVAPSIHGHNFIKTALMLAMFGGEPKDVAGKHKIRGDINILLLGDPGTAKSQFLKYVEKTFHRVVYTTGKGASAVGLTAGVIRDPITKEWMLEGGALVLADKGVCLIDEFDKMNEVDRTSIHEAMEQQSISISKAGIVTSLKARCSVIAAANPIFGRYDPQRNFMDNVDLTDPIISRFDILSVVRDEVDYYKDRSLATFVINSHIRSHPLDNTPERLNETLLEEDVTELSKDELLSQQLLKKYIIYARKFIHPKLTDVDKEKISDFYSAIRKYSSAVGGLPIGIRHIESMLRMSEAHAKMHLREYVQTVDIDLAIKMLLESFLQSQKSSLASALRPKLIKFLSHSEDDYDLLLHTLNKLAKEKASFLRLNNGGIGGVLDIEISVHEFSNETKDISHYTIEKFFKSVAFCKQYSIEGDFIKTKVI